MRSYAISAILLTVLLLTGFSRQTFAQRPVFGDADSISTEPMSLGFDAEVGLSVFENELGESERYFSSVLMPTISKGLWKAGLMLKLRLNKAGIREEDYDEPRDFLTIIRFVQYAEKEAHGPYGRLGDLDEARIGFGQVVNDYRNTVSLDRPRLGFEFDIDSGRLLLESFASDLSGIGVYGIRGAFRPFIADEGRRRQNTVFGLSVSGDLGRESRLYNSVNPGVAFLVDSDALPIDSLDIVFGEEGSRPLFISLDAGMPITTTKTDELLGYVTVTNMMDHGWGMTLGGLAKRDLEEGRLEGWLEQRVSFGEYLPSYFNSLYEVDRIRDFSVSLEDGTERSAATGKRNLLEARTGTEFGSFVAFAYRYKRLFRLKTSYEHAWNRKRSGWFRADIRMQHPDLMYIGRLSYDVINVGSIEDITEGPSENALFRVAAAYRFWKHILLGAQLRQSFEPRELNGRIVGQSKRTRFEPYFMLRI